MKSTFRICFKLEPIDHIVPWQRPDGTLNLHWFGLTSGDYWISTPLGEALRYTEERQGIWNLASPHVDYQIARLFEDVQSVLPFALEPVPSDIADLTGDPAWYARSVEWMEDGEASDDKLDLWYGANQWWNDRHIDTAYLVDGPHFYFWRVKDQVFVRWEQSSNEKGVWEVPSGQFAIEAAEFATVIFGFLDEVIRQMEQRVKEIKTKGWMRTDCSLDLEGLIREQQQRTSWVAEVKERRADTDWASVRDFQRRLRIEVR